MPHIADIIACKRDAKQLDALQIDAFVQGIGDGIVSDAQIAAFAMATLINGMVPAETVALTQAMAASGEKLDWSDLDGPVLDKHSSGGIGDKVSLVLAPLLAACGAFVPMISGRGLGHTGGTLDKLESLAGYRVDVDAPTLRKCVQQAGCAIVGATEKLAPADRHIYAVRDLTATVESQPLITSSILSKKLAAGPQALVMDIKTGSGAFCPTLREAAALARDIVTTANDAGLPTRAVITDMNQCLGHNAGNALEVEEALALLRGDACCQRLESLVIELAIELLCLGGMFADPVTARETVSEALRSGAAMERFERMAVELGANGVALPASAPVIQDIPAPRNVGFVHKIDARALGMSVIELGGGRTKAGEAIDHRVGFSHLAAIGDSADRPLGRVHARSFDDAARAISRIHAAYQFCDEPIAAPPLIHARINA